MVVYVDARNQILGRMAVKVAKLALLGETVRIVNCEKAVITGSRSNILERYQFITQELGHISPFKGQFFPRHADGIVKRTIRGMIPHHGERGRKALARIKCYLKVPQEFADKDIQFWEGTSIARLKMPKFMTVEELAVSLGGKPVK